MRGLALCTHLTGAGRRLPPTNQRVANHVAVWSSVRGGGFRKLDVQRRERHDHPDEVRGQYGKGTGGQKNKFEPNPFDVKHDPIDYRKWMFPTAVVVGIVGYYMYRKRHGGDGKADAHAELAQALASQPPEVRKAYQPGDPLPNLSPEASSAVAKKHKEAMNDPDKRS